MLHELIGKKMIHSLMSNAASELALACERNDDTSIKNAFSRVCAYGMDLGIHPSKEGASSVVEEVLDKVSPQEKIRIRNI